MFVNIAPSAESAQVRCCFFLKWLAAYASAAVGVPAVLPLLLGAAASKSNRSVSMRCISFTAWLTTLLCCRPQESLCSLRFAAKVNACEIGTAKRSVTTAK